VIGKPDNDPTKSIPFPIPRLRAEDEEYLSKDIDVPLTSDSAPSSMAPSSIASSKYPSMQTPPNDLRSRAPSYQIEVPPPATQAEILAATHELRRAQKVGIVLLYF